MKEGTISSLAKTISGSCGHRAGHAGLGVSSSLAVAWPGGFCPPRSQGASASLSPLPSETGHRAALRPDRGPQSSPRLPRRLKTCSRTSIPTSETMSRLCRGE